MADLNNNIRTQTNQFTAKFLIDRNESSADSQSIDYHRNGLFQSVKTTEIFSVNEPSTLKCVELPYNYLGHLQLITEGEHLVFSGDEVNSEIGIVNTLDCSYAKIVNSPCLNFSKYNGAIRAFLRVNQDKEQEVTFIDGKNPDRFLNLDKIPYEYVIDEETNCKVKVYSSTPDCDEMRLNPFVTIPALEVTRGAAGNLPNGMYSVHIAYTINDLKFSDYMSSTVPIMINPEVNGTNSIYLNISNLDRDFDKYELVLTGIVNGKTQHKRIGLFPTSQTYVTITDWENDEYTPITTEELLTHKVIYDTTNILAANSEYLFRADVTRKPEINYQPQAFNIITKYVVKRVPLRYYIENGIDIGYFRNENYNFVIRWYWADGQPTKHAQVAGRRKTNKDKLRATGKDIFENDIKVTTIQHKRGIEYWEAYNTAGQMIPEIEDTDPNEISTVNEKIVGTGLTGYFESTTNYPDDLEIYGDDACTPIRYHKMPDESKVPRYWVDPETGETFIQILGVKFENIEYPKDKDGNYIQGISHYEILRSDRDEADSTVVARGIVTNMGEFVDERGTVSAYSNFPHNSVKPNTYISKKQTFRVHGVEKNFNPLNKFYRDRFTLYTPHGNYFGRRSLASTYINFETEEVGETEGYFEEPHEHPRQKLLTNYAFYVAACVGVIEALSMVVGTRTVTTNQSQMPYDMAGLAIGSMNLGTSTTLGSLYPTQQTVAETNRLSFPRFYADLKGTPGALIPVKFVINTIKLLIALGGFVLEAAKFVEEILETIKNFSGDVQYARQFNSVVNYTKQLKVQKGNIRRAFEKQPFYLDNGIHNSGGVRINNGGRNGGIYLHLKYPVPFPKTQDTSRFTMSEAKLTAKATNKVKAISSVYYVSIMKHNANQYGSLEHFKAAKVHSNPIEVGYKNRGTNIFDSPIMFGGDCIITEQTHLNRCPLFRQDLTNIGRDNNVDFDYRLYPNIGFPRYWVDTTPYDVGNMMNVIGKAQPKMEKLPNQKFNLDLSNSRKNEFIEKDQVFYTSVNGVFRYIVEVPYNIAFRGNKGEGEGSAMYAPHYSDEQANLSYIFRSDMKTKPENYSLDPSYSRLTQTYVLSQALTKIPKAPIREKNTVLYSLPSVHTQSFNNWRYFLPLNRFDFDERDFGELTGLHALDQDRLLFLFSKASPFISPGRDFLELNSGRKVTIGDGGLFAQTPREMMKTHIAYGSNHDKFAFNSNQFGNFYVSEQQGKLFNLTNKLDEYSRNGWHKWCANFLPLQLKRQFPLFKGIHNPLAGVGYQLVFDNFYETLYICKKDYYAINPEVKYVEKYDRFEYKSREIKLGDPEFFEDCSMTLSYNPAMEAFVSFHDWHPDGVIQEERHFLTAKGNTLWKHNDRMDSFCNFYGKDYPYQLGFTISTGQSTTTLNNIEYIQESYIYKTNEYDRYATFDETFDWAMVYNQDQLSGMLKLIPSTDLRDDFRRFPNILSDYQMEIPLKKAEGKWRFNMFYDYTKNRGRYENYDHQPFITKKNGYDRIINRPYLDFQANLRPPRFRNIWHSVWFSREKCNNIQFITKFANSQLNVSPR